MIDLLYCLDVSAHILAISRLDDHGLASLFCDGYTVFPKSLVEFFFQIKQKQQDTGYRDGNSIWNYRKQTTLSLS